MESLAFAMGAEEVVDESAGGNAEGSGTDTGESTSGGSVRDLYPEKEDAGMDALPTRGTQALSEPQVRTHGAHEISDGALNAGHGVAIAVMLAGIVLIVLARGPRKVDALETIWSQKHVRR